MSRGCLPWRGQRSMQRWPDKRTMPEHKRRAVSFCKGVVDIQKPYNHLLGIWNRMKQQLIRGNCK
jgi:hypothetical protein